MLVSPTMKYKNQVANSLANNRDIIQVLEPDPTKKLMYSYIFPYLFVPGVEETVRSVVCFALNSNNQYGNDWFKDSSLIFYLICHNKHLETEYGGTRVDVLEGLVIEEFNQNNRFGLTLKLKQSQESVLNSTYYFRTLVFNTLAYNGDCAVLPNG